MKVCVIGHAYPDSFARCIVDGLGDLGHQAWAINPDPFVPMPMLSRAYALVRPVLGMLSRHPRLEARQDRQVVKQIEAARPDLVIATGRGLQPRFVALLKQRLRCQVVFMFSDHLANFERQYPFASDYDALFFKDPYIVEFVRSKLGLEAYYMPEACNPKWHRRVTLTTEEQAFYGCDLTTAGNMYIYRAKILERFVTYDMKIWGASFPGWLDSPLRANYRNVYVAELEKAKAFNAAKIVLNTMHYAEIKGVNLRTFEVAGCGAFQIADFRPGLADLFEPDREIVTYASADELQDKVDYYLAHPAQRQTIADAGYARAHRDHTYVHRLQRLLRVTAAVKRGRVDEPALSFA